MKFSTLVLVIVVIGLMAGQCKESAEQTEKDRRYLDSICGYPNCGVK